MKGLEWYLQIWRMSDSIYSAEEDDSLERIRYLGRLPCSKLAVVNLY